MRANNSIQAVSVSGTPNEVKDSDSISESKEQKMLEKTGSYDANAGVINWKVVFNQAGKNISGLTLTDQMLGSLPDASSVTVTPNDGGYAIQYNPDGSISGIHFQNYPTSTYEGVNVEVMRYRNGEIMAREDARRGLAEDVDYVAGVPDTGIPHAIGYANAAKATFARPFIKYTPTWSRSFMSANPAVRSKVAKMKQIPVHELIEGKKLLFIDDSVVRGTQLRETVDFLYENGAKEVHMRSACPPIMYECKYLSFSSSKSEMELLARKVVDELEGEEGHKHLDEYADANTERGQCMLKKICEKFRFDSMGYQSIEGLLEAIGIDPEKVCTYCWTGKE